MFRNVAIIMSVVSLILGQPLQDLAISKESNETRYMNSDDVSKLTRSSLGIDSESNAFRQIVEVVTKLTSLQLVDTSANWATISQIKSREKREVITVGAVLAATVAVMSAATVRVIHEYALSEPSQETLKAPTLGELVPRGRRSQNFMHF